MTKPRYCLTALEEYFLLEDRPAYPWSFFLRLEFSGGVDRQAAEQALVTCLDRHPLLASVVRRENGAWVWQTSDAPSPGVQWTAIDDAGPFPPATRLNIEEEMGVRVHGVVGLDRTRLTFQFNHVACDARGAMTFIADWLAEYSRARGGRLDGGMSSVYDAALLLNRDVHAAARLKTVASLRRRWAGLVRVGRFLVRSPSPLVAYRPADDDDAAPLGFPAACTFRFDEAATAALRAAAKRKGATVNDCLCCDLFLAMEQFRGARQEPQAWLRVVVPVDLRTEIHRSISAANLTSLTFLTRHSAACSQPAALLQGIHDEMQQVKTGRLALSFHRGLQIRRRLPGGLARGVRGRKCQATATMTNAGELLAESSLPRHEGRLVAGNLTLAAIDFLAPIRPLTCASFSACTYAGRLSLSLQYDPRAISADLAGQLLQGLVERLQSRLE